ncbi:hypothetical protein GGD56_005846 [Rhizobium mongolense]|uniref:Anti-sigma factor NepR domain-containing protein n=4 Tax=Rhizobium mongolense TaxID=57676 RepID=A0ABR6IVL2_9HYPH|nr:hypothetical protein [Rhizobium mongolense]
MQWKRRAIKKVPVYAELFSQPCIMLATNEGRTAILSLDKRQVFQHQPPRAAGGGVGISSRSANVSSIQTKTTARSDEFMKKQQTEEQNERRLEMRASDILDPNNQIGVKLRSLYAAAQDEAIPDRFLDLLEKLDQAEMMASAKLAE